MDHNNGHGNEREKEKEKEQNWDQIRPSARMELAGSCEHGYDCSCCMLFHLVVVAVIVFSRWCWLVVGVAAVVGGELASD